MSTDQTITGQKTFSADTTINGTLKANKLMVGSLDKTPENQLVVYNAGETDTFIQVTNGVTGTGAGDGLIVGVEADGDAVLRVDYGKYLSFKRKPMDPYRQHSYTVVQHEFM